MTQICIGHWPQSRYTVITNMCCVIPDMQGWLLTQAVITCQHPLAQLGYYYSVPGEDLWQTSHVHPPVLVWQQLKLQTVPQVLPVLRKGFVTLFEHYQSPASSQHLLTMIRYFWDSGSLCIHFRIHIESVPNLLVRSGSVKLSRSGSGSGFKSDHKKP